MSVDRDIRYELLARLCPNSTGAEIRSVCTEAGMFAIRARRKLATEKDFLEAINKDKDSSKLVFISSYEANDYLHDFNDKCDLIMLMPIMREGQKRTFSLNQIKISEDIMQEILIYSGSFYFNSIEEQEQFLSFIFYVPNPRTQIQIELLDQFKIERNGFVLAKNRKVLIY